MDGSGVEQEESCKSDTEEHGTGLESELLMDVCMLDFEEQDLCLDPYYFALDRSGWEEICQKTDLVEELDR
jgi:hypothetical protein